jgi:hypothetical protein
MSEKLKPCPSCKSTKWAIVKRIVGICVLCETCGEHTTQYDTERKAIKEWNRRADNDK